MARILIAGGKNALTERLATALRAVNSATEVAVTDRAGDDELLGSTSPIPETAIYLASARGARGYPDLGDAATVLSALEELAIERVVLISSAAIYEPNCHHPGNAGENQLNLPRTGNRVTRLWRDLEGTANQVFGADSAQRLTILRPAAMPIPGGDDFFSCLLAGRVAWPYPGFDPCMQFLIVEDLASAISAVLERSAPGVFNVAPRSVISLHRALRRAGVRRLPIPRTPQRVARALLGGLRSVFPIGQIDYMRALSTVSDEKLERETGFAARLTSGEVIDQFTGREPGSEPNEGSVPEADTDPFGLDPEYIRKRSATILKFLNEVYFRAEVEGIEHIPQQGPAIIAGLHRGMMPLDGIMTMYDIVKLRGRVPRFLIHPALVKTPYSHNFIRKVGGVLACMENSDWVLERDGLLAVLPEGAWGGFSLYKDAYKIRKFGQNRFVKMALRQRAPIVPFVTIGPAEALPLIGRIDWRWWRKFAEWPFLPVNLFLPFFPIPLPAKFHTRYLPPIDIAGEYPPEAADDPGVVREISDRVRSAMTEAMEEMLRRRRSIFFGSIFDDEESGPKS